MAVSPELTTRAKIGSLASRIYPGLDEAILNRKRDREMRAEIETGGYASALSDVPIFTTKGRPSHLVVVPQIGPDAPTWKPAGGNFFYEIAQAAREYAGADKVTIFGVDAAESPAAWHQRLIRFLISSEATHVIGQVESDPNSSGASQTWDTLWSQLSTRWDGVLLGVVTDSSFRYITFAARRLARISSRFVLVDICIPMDGVMKRGRVEVGPVNMPVSNETLAVIDEHSAGLSKIYDVAFIGVLYPYRIEMLDDLRALGVRVAVNPHRGDDNPSDLTGDLRANQPSWLDYMLALAQSNLVLNFSQSSAGPYQQLKTRVLEASALGCVILTDDVDRTDRFWVPEEEYGYFATLADVPAVVERFLADPAKLAAAQAAAKARARAINVTSFWGGIEDGLRARGLPPFKDA
ncbi:MAG: glycosyltransferase [Actinobacteria bacterium]|nr:glycosyltransferase [Actinomycetota bacterium]